MIILYFSVASCLWCWFSYCCFLTNCIYFHRAGSEDPKGWPKRLLILPICCKLQTKGDMRQLWLPVFLILVINELLYFPTALHLSMAIQISTLSLIHIHRPKFCSVPVHPHQFRKLTEIQLIKNPHRTLVCVSFLHLIHYLISVMLVKKKCYASFSVSQRELKSKKEKAVFTFFFFWVLYNGQSWNQNAKTRKQRKCLFSFTVLGTCGREQTRWGVG